MATAKMRVTILGCGSSPGVPRPNGDFGCCDPGEPKNYRTRSALLVERIAEGGRSVVVIDTGPDFRVQMIREKIKHIDGVIYTHGHADHIHGIDDLRSFALTQHERIPVYADKSTLERLYQGFGYCFRSPRGSNYPPILRAHEISPNNHFQITGQGGTISFMPLLQIHGSGHSLGFRIGNMAYCTDVNQFPPETLQQLYNLDMLIIDALQYERHPSHFSYQEALTLIKELQPKRVLLTHMHTALDYQTLLRETPEHVEPAYDGLVFEYSP